MNLDRTDSLDRDPFINAINNGIRRDINILIENKGYRGAAVLIFSGIDAMANLNRPEEKEYSEPEDFKNWVKEYFHLEGDTQITPEEWWAARNAKIHTYTIYSKGHKKDNVRALAYMGTAVPEVIYNPKKLVGVVLVAVSGMRDKFFKGLDRFLIEALANPNRRSLIEKRLNELNQMLPYDQAKLLNPKIAEQQEPK